MVFAAEALPGQKPFSGLADLHHQTLDLLRGRGRHPVEGEPIAGMGGRTAAVQDQHVGMHVEVECGANPLQDRERSRAGPVHAVLGSDPALHANCADRRTW